MLLKPPIFLFAFANDDQNALLLQEEERKIRALLEDQHDNRQIECHFLNAASLDDIYSAFNRFHNRIHLFHYGGHSDHTFLGLTGKSSRADNLATLLGMQENLKLVFLNGCANKGQLGILFDKGVNAAIATSTSINDQKAILFSTTFFDALKNKKTVLQSFAVAKARLQEEEPTLTILEHRGRRMREADTFEWGIYAPNDQDLEWTIPDPYKLPPDLDYTKEVELTNPDTNKVFVELAMQGMAQYNKKSAFLWEDYQDPDSEDTNIYDLQEAIYNSFPSILSIQIRDLFTENAKKKGRLRLQELYEVYLVLGKLLSSIALANLWDALLDDAFEPDPRFVIQPAYKKDLHTYLDQQATPSEPIDYFWLLATVGHIFRDNEATPFIEELTDLNELLINQAELFTAYQFLEFELKRRLEQKNIASQEVQELCDTAEQHLGILLKACAFLITYQMVSVNDISVQKMLLTPEPDFVHNKVILKGVEQTTMDQDPLPRKSFTCNHAVVVTKNFKSQDAPLTLIPFVIDENAYKLKRKEQSKIHFYKGKTPEGNLHYQHAEDLFNGFELPTTDKYLYRIQELDEIVHLFNRFKEHLKLER